jgi:hypothetical protein
MALSTRARLAWAVLAVAVIGGAAYLVWRDRRPDPGGSHTTGFRNAAAEAGLEFRMSFLPDEQGDRFKINLYDHGCGLAVADYDGDGHDDVYFCNQLGPNVLYRNKGDGNFEDITERARVALGDRICTGAAFADIDNDGDPDLFVTSTRGGNVLFRNDEGTFTNVTREAGLAHAGHSQMGVFFDADGDGFLDLLVLQTAKWTTEVFNRAGRHYTGKETLAQTAASEKEYNLFYHNNGNGTFSEQTEKSGLRGLGWAADAAVFDYNDDGRLDVLVTNMFGRAQLFRNDGGTFTDVALAVLGPTSWGGMGVKAFDFNNDGRLDVYMVDMHSDMWVPDTFDPSAVDEKKKYRHLLGGRFRSPERDQAAEWELATLVKVKYDEVVFGNTFFKNLGGGKFEEVSDRANLETFWPWGLAVGDFDNDGFEDVFEPAGMGYPFFYWPNYLLMNNGAETFTDRAAAEGIEPPADRFYQDPHIRKKPPTRSSRAAVVADFDGDGRLDILTSNFNDAPYYFRNQFPRRDYIAWRLTGTRGNRDAIGATVTLHLEAGGVMVRQVHAAGGYLAQSSRTLHFGLGGRTKVERAEIRWPNGGRQTIPAPEINKLHRLTEPAG